MKVIGLNGSPNQESNTKFLLQQALGAAAERGAETELLDVDQALAELNTPFCVHCSSPCNQSCYQGTLMEDYFQSLKEADGLILGSPVYFGSVSGQLKSFWDLTRFLRSNNQLFNTIGGALAVGASRFGGQETAVSTLQDMMLIQGMTIVGDSSGQGMGHQGACGQSEIKTDSPAQVEAVRLGARVAELAKKMTD